MLYKPKWLQPFVELCNKFRKLQGKFEDNIKMHLKNMMGGYWLDYFGSE